MCVHLNSKSGFDGYFPLSLISQQTFKHPSMLLIEARNDDLCERMTTELEKATKSLAVVE
jgi:hypothetical protein